MSRLELCDGKYIIINELESGGGLKALRYGEEWRSLAGDNLVLALYQKVEELQTEIERLTTTDIRKWELEFDDMKVENQRLQAEIERIRTTPPEGGSHPNERSHHQGSPLSGQPPENGE